MRKAWGKGKNEVLALKIDILELSGQGMNYSEIYRRLTSLGTLTVSLSTFLRCARKICDDPPSSSAPRHFSSSPVEANASQGVRRKFHFNQNPDLDELFKSSDKT